MRPFLLALAFCGLSSAAFAQAYPSPRFGNVNVSSGGSYQINGTSVLSAVGGAPTLGTLPVTVGSSGAASANDTLIAAALAAMNTAGGGTIRLPCGDVYTSATIDNKYPRVLVEGCGDDYQHNAGSNPTYGTRIVPTFAGTALKHRTPYSSTTTKFFGGGFRHLTVIGNSIATRLLEVDSIAGGEYDLYLEDSVGAEAAYFKSGVTGTDLAEDAGIQLARINLRIRQLDSVAAANADGVVFDGSTNANFSYNPWVVLDVTYKNGTAAKFKNADNNTITFRSFRAPGGTGKAIRMYGAQASGVVGGTLNRFMRLQAAVADGSTTDLIYSEGTDTGGVSAGVQNDIQALDTGNGTPDPTHGTGSLWRWTNNLTLATHGSGSFDLNTGSSYQINGTSILGGLTTTTPTVDGSFATMQNGTKTASQIYAPVLPANYYFYDSTRSVLDLEPGATVQQGAAYGAYTYANVAQGSNPNQKNAVGLFTLGVNATNNAATWGLNTACNDNTTNGLATLVGRKCIGWEADFQVNGASTIQGASLIIQGAGTPAGANGVQISQASGSTAKWTNAFITGDGAATTAMIVGGASVAGANVPSQPAYFTVYDSGSVGHYVTAQAVPVGTNTAMAFTDNVLANGIALLNTATGTDPQVFPTGSDTNRSLVLLGKGTGNVKLLRPQLTVTTAATVLAITCNSGMEGTLYSVTDANSAVFNAAIASGGANHVMAYCNGTGWTVH